MMKDDSRQNFEENPFLDFTYGYLFPPNMRYFGFALMILCIFLVFESVIIAALVGFLGAWMAFRKSGVQLKPLQKSRREYTSFLWKRGKWHSYEDYPYLAVLRSKEGFTVYSRGMMELTDSYEVYDIYLLSKDHRKRLIVARGQDRNAAVSKGQDLARSLGLEWTTYSPARSERTRSRPR